MDCISENPFRVLGVFANDQLKTRTANMAKIRAFRKVGKECSFDSDFKEIFGPIDRSEESVERAVSLLSSKEDADYYACMWLHRTDSINCSSTAAIDIIRACIDESDCNNANNVAIGALTVSNYELAAKAFSLLFEDANALSQEVIGRVLTTLCHEYANDDENALLTWWTLFKEVSLSDSLEKIQNVFNKESIKQLQAIADDSDLKNHVSNWNQISAIHCDAKPIIDVLKDTSDIDTNEPNAEGQVALSNYAQTILAACKRYYTSTRFWEQKPVETLIVLLREVYRLSYDSKVKEYCTEFGKSIKTDLKYLAPQELVEQSTKIRKEVEFFCTKPCETKWSELLLEHCVDALKTIKEKAGATSPYYLRVSSQIADNAIYACDCEIEDVLLQYNNPNTERASAFANIMGVLKQSAQLCLNLAQLKLEADVTTKLNKLKSRVEEFSKTHSEFKLSFPLPTISLVTEGDIYALCSDYQSLIDFTKKYPHSSYCKEAISRIWKIEDEAYPQMGTSITDYRKLFIAYKEKYPESHNEARLLADVERLLLGHATLPSDEYRKILQLWPNHPKKYLILSRLDTAVFIECNSIESWLSYVKDFPNGNHIEEARIIIAKAKKQMMVDEYNGCKSIAEYNRFVLKYPASDMSELALKRIEDIIYQGAMKIGNSREYLAKYPQGRYAQKLREQEESQAFKKCKSIDEHKKFMTAFPRSKYAIVSAEIIKKNKQRKLRTGIVVVLVAIVGTLAYNLNLRSDSQASVKQATERTNTAPATVEQPTQSSISNIVNETVSDPDEPYYNNSLQTGAKPYASYFGKARKGSNYFTFNTSEGSDYVVIVKRHSDGRYINHTYIRGGDNATLYAPDGTFDVYFYSGTGWNPNKTVGSFTGGFVFGGTTQKDGPVDLRNAYMEYTLYPVQNGNLRLEGADEGEVFN